ncbi:DNA ligase D [Arvimicrobium flavum]|uniref:DNA ligase D n=1 Tax=Arvimicrobium flavum TaxID=3393320 RepID=UPI00237AB03E|nr:DNA ligase D [Mesorhizobium shangrilense]
MERLEAYRAKRDFRKTKEPSGKARARSRSNGGIFVVHKHAATRLHYDLRLEHDGVLWSWAVTRGPSLDPSEKRLAVHVEDHPLDYASFEGNIPKGEYGAGAVIVWDEGTWVPEFDADFGMRKGHISFELKGGRLNGHWHLVRLKPRAGERTENWLLIKADDAAARPGEDIVADAPESVKSGLTIEEIAAGKTARSKPRIKAAPAKTKARSKRAAGSAELPDFVPPCLATLASSPPEGEEWVHEVKFDGYRLQARLDGGKVRLLTRTGLDWTPKFDSVAKALEPLDCDTALIDGEVVVLAEGGQSSFSALQQALSERRPDRMIFYAFDLLFLDGVDLREEPLAERKERLRLLLGEDTRSGALRYSEHFSEPGGKMLRHVCRMGLEGLVSKRTDAPYRSGRGSDWIKAKCTLRQEFVIVGYLPSEKTGRGLRSLVMGYHEDGKLRPAGNVGTGFSLKEGNELKHRLDGIRAAKAPFGGDLARDKRVVWVKPELVAEVEYRSLTSDNILRHASFQGLREDKPARDVVAEVAKDARSVAKPKARAERAEKAGGRPMTSIELSNADKVLWPDTGNTKRDLLDHYERVWDRMERFVANRPLSLVRAPDGVEKQRFFQKHASKGMSDAIRVLKDPQDGEELLYVTDFDGVAALVQMGVVEIHVWGSTNDMLEQPDNIVFDLDPDEGLDVEDVRAATLDVKRRLDELEMPALVKTSGGKGFHVVVPLKPKADWQTVKTFAHDFARAMEQSDPDKYTATLSKKARTGRIFIDYLRNGRGATAVAPWSSRAKPKSTVAVPVTWEEIAGKRRPDDFTMGGKLLDGALKGPDAWADFDKMRRALRR